MAEFGYAAGISSTYRDNESQNALYAQGRTTSGNIVTNARGGQSVHNYRLAFDIFLNIKGKEYSDASFFKTAGRIWEEMGGEWGGSWKGFVDTPHMQFTGGLSLSDLQKGKVLPADSVMPWERDLGCTNEQPNTGDNNSGEGEEMARYKALSDLPEWAKPTIQKLIDKQYLSGNGQDLDLSEDMIRTFVVLDRAGNFD